MTPFAKATEGHASEAFYEKNILHERRAVYTCY